MFDISDALALVQMEASLARINTGTGQAALHIYTNNRPNTTNSPPGQEPQAVIELASPAGTMTEDGRMSLIPANPSGAMVLFDGIPRWGRLVAADGAVMADGDVTGPMYAGDIKIVGGKIPAGDTSPMLYAGGLVVLSATALT